MRYKKLSRRIRGRKLYIERQGDSLGGDWIHYLVLENSAGQEIYRTPKGFSLVSDSEFLDIFNEVRSLDELKKRTTHVDAKVIHDRSFEKRAKRIFLIKTAGKYYLAIREKNQEMYRTPKELSLDWNRERFIDAYKRVATQQELEDLVNSPLPSQS